jgi:hypothetical protein
MGAEHLHPKVEVFSNRKGRLEGILVAQIVRLLGDRQFRISTFKYYITSSSPHQTRQEAQ